MGKDPTWDFMKRCHKIGMGQCYLWKHVEETILHPFTHCLFIIEVWSEFLGRFVHGGLHLSWILHKDGLIIERAINLNIFP